MKTYNRETRKYEEVTTGNGKFKKRELCRGGAEHRYLLTVPPYHLTENITPEGIVEYYESEKRIGEFVTKEHEKLEKLGVKMGKHRFITKYKSFVCSVCAKHKMME